MLLARPPTPTVMEFMGLELLASIARGNALVGQAEPTVGFSIGLM